MGSLQDDIMPKHRIDCLPCPTCKSQSVYYGNINGWMLVDCAVHNKIAYNVLGLVGIKRWDNES